MQTHNQAGKDTHICKCIHTRTQVESKCVFVDPFFTSNVTEGIALLLNQPKPSKKTRKNSKLIENKWKKAWEEQFSERYPPAETQMTQRGTDHRLNTIVQ